MSDLELALQHEEGMAGKENLIYLMEQILNYPKTGKIHSEVMEQLRRVEQSKHKRGLFLLPRNHLKTTEITISYPIQRLLRDPNLRILITNELLANSKSFLREIKGHFERNEKLRFLYGNQVNSEEKWTETQIVIPSRTINRKEPSIQVGSVDTSLTSQHYDLIICDDLVSRANITTKEQMDKVKQYYRDIQSLLEPGGMLIIVGTRWHFDDLYGQILEDEDYQFMIKTCWDENGLPVFPEKFTMEQLQKLQRPAPHGIGAYDFSCQYLNNPVDDENADFKRSWFENRYEPRDIAGIPMNVYVTIDNAPSTKKGSDWQGIIVNGVDEHGRWYLLHVERFKGTTPQLINRVFELYAAFNPVIIGIEQKAYEDLIKPYLDIEKQKRNQFPYVIELKDKGVRKEDRIRGRLQGRFQSSSIFLKKNPQDNTEDLVDEALRFPKGKYDDLLDALQYQDEIANRPNSGEFGPAEDDEPRRGPRGRDERGMYQGQSFS